MSASYTHQGQSFKRSSVVYTPRDLCQWLYDTLSPHIKPKVILDPSVGSGNLPKPWTKDSIIIGVDIVDSQPLNVDRFIKYPFDVITKWSYEQPDLIICNPPFSGAKEQMMMPERFIRKFVELFGKDIPIVLFAPHGFRFNNSQVSKRRSWFKSGEAPEISSVVSLPSNVFPAAKVLSEIMIFNVDGLKPHYWY